MATNLTYIFGNEIRVCPMPERIQQQFTAFPGANGLTCMHMGMRGKEIIITGRLRAYGSTYYYARKNLQNWIDDIDSWRQPGVGAKDYYFMGETFEDCVFGPFNLIPDADGKAIHFNSNGRAFCDFVCVLISLA